MSAYRISYLRPAGWLRLGASASLGLCLSTPMIWALGGFGPPEDALRRALVFLLGALIMPIVVAIMIGWSVRGFAVKIRDPDDDADSPPRRPAIPHHPAPPHAAAPHAVARKG